MDIQFLDILLFSTYFILLFFSIFWLLVLFSSDQEIKKKKLTEFPLFTTIVPAYNEERTIIGTLESLINLDYPADKMEIIVVNDGSKDQTQKLIEDFIIAHPRREITLINQTNHGKGRAMNVGLAKAKGKYFACLDADSFVYSNALQEMLPYFETDESIAAVCPLLKVKKPNNIIQKVQWIEYIINMFYRKLNAKLDCIHVTPGPFSVYNTEIIRKIGGFDEHTITEDLELAIRLQKNQYRIVQTYDAIVETVTPQNWKALFKQRVRWYKGSVDNVINYRKMIFDRKYGDFGIVRMPTIILSGIIVIVLFITLLQDLSSKLIDGVYFLKAINFDLITLAKNVSFDFNFLNLPFTKITIALTLFSISFLIMIYSYQTIKEKITNHGRTFSSMIVYLFVYGIFITSVWMYIAFLFLFKKRNKW